MAHELDYSSVVYLPLGFPVVWVGTLAEVDRFKQMTLPVIIGLVAKIRIHVDVGLLLVVLPFPVGADFALRVITACAFCVGAGE